MTNEPPTDDPNDREDQPADRNGGDREPRRSRSWLSTLLTALDRLDRASRTEQTNVDYSVSIRSGLENLADRGPERDASRLADRPGTGRTGGPPSSSDRDRRVSRQREHVSTRTYDDELLLTAELADVEPEDVTVGFDGDTLVVGVEGRELDRVYVPWPDRSATAAIRNDVLTVTVTPDTHE